jgi:hypothetical protein
VTENRRTIRQIPPTIDKCKVSLAQYIPLNALSSPSDITKLCCLYLIHVNYYYANNKENPRTNGNLNTVKKEEKNLPVVRATAVMFISPCPLLPPGTLF